MRRSGIIFSIVIFGFALLRTGCPAHADATPAVPVITKDAANKFYSDCLNHSDPPMSADARQSMCACTSAQLAKGAMSPDDMAALSDKGQKGIAARNKMLVDGYAPCLADPIRDIIQAECLRSPRGQTADGRKICACVVKLTGDWYALSGRQVIALAMKADADMSNPIARAMQTAEFKSEEEKNIKSCQQEH